MPIAGASCGTKTWWPAFWRTRDTLGRSRYPAILLEEQFRSAQERRRNRAVPVRKTPAQLELRRLCGSSPPAWVEQQTLALLNRLIRDPESIVPGRTEVEEPAEARKLRRELDEMLHTPPVDDKRAREIAFQMAGCRLNTVGSEEYETPPAPEALSGNIHS